MNKSSKVALLFLVLSISACAVTGRICQALVLEAGGDHGGYEAGVLDVLINNATNPNDTLWDVVTGVSIGAINTGYISQYKVGDEKNMIVGMLQLWEQITSADIYQSWEGGMVQGLLFESSIFDESPIIPFLEQHITLPPQRSIRISATDSNTASYITFKETDLPTADDLRTVMRSSSAVPMVFPHVNYLNYTFIDGGVLDCLNLGAAVAACRGIADSDKDIYIDTILDDYIANLAPVNADDDSAFSIFSRGMSIMSYYNGINLLLQAQEEFPDVNFRYTIRPTKALPDPTLPLGFKHDEIMTMIALGQSDATAAIQKGPGVAHKEVIEEIKKELKSLKRKAHHSVQASLKAKLKEEARKMYEDQVKRIEL
mmetsp:Transcript_17779/g.20261  ORF Transcript_17779/g.20261 Transcript_17779/m.20261 type:complete len:371 (+) Transcript_17779:31-1143(+)